MSEAHSVAGRIPPLPRKQEDLPPFNNKLTHSSAEVSNAIRISVEPYRRDLDNKSELLNDAVDMIKTRNERIKEMESPVLDGNHCVGSAFSRGPPAGPT